MGGYDGVEAGVLLPVGSSLGIVALRAGGFPEGLSLAHCPSPVPLPFLDRGVAISLCIGRVGWLCYVVCGAGDLLSPFPLTFSGPFFVRSGPRS
jgi:hypothetical protein